jgi:tetratricopeptide (TPR) repeat protein
MKRIVAILLITPHLAFAQGDPIQRGIDLRRQGKDAEALAVFKEAHQARPTPRSLAQIALAESALGRFVEAERHLQEALAAKDEWIAKNREVLEKALAGIGQKLGTLVIRTRAAEVLVNNEKASAGEIRSLPGSYEIEVRAADHEPARRIVTVTAGSRVEVVLDPTPLQKTTPPPPAPVPPPVFAPQSPFVISTPPPPAVEPQSSSKRTWAWVSTAGAVLSLGAGAYGLGMYLDRSSDYRACGRNAPRSQECPGDLEALETGRAIAVGGFAVGAISAGLATWFFMSSAPKRQVACGPMGLGLSCGGTL